MKTLNFLKEYCDEIECDGCYFRNTSSYGCPFAKAPRHWNKETIRKACMLIEKEIFKLEGEEDAN